MANALKTLVATGCSSGLGFDAIKQLLTKQPPLSPPVNISTALLGVRDAPAATAAYTAAGLAPTVVPLELSDLSSVKEFAAKTLEVLGSAPLDYLLLNAANAYTVDHGSRYGKWCEQYIVNHLSQHYLLHLLRPKLVESKTRIVVVSSGAIRGVSDPSIIEEQLKGTPGPTYIANVYQQTKFVQLLGAHWWRRQLAGQCTVVAVSPGMVPGTRLTRGSDFNFPANSPDARSVEDGATSILQALVRSDLPENPDQIFLTSWGEWWGTDVIGLTLDKGLQDKWSPSKEEIEEIMATA
ncbi:hypothetical protein GGX14DRAFT_456789 [Mycena pura]|uniref:Uncharacterized protein n=1 Tax=Mycena pura TaxID=153505 RepID=A0AAD6Y9C1_9AGAR|nr:hypothetical protein GGX14DRAFT_456789 [Mycena pura]